MRYRARKLGKLLILAGVLVLAALILPSELWPFCVGVLLIAAGFALCLG
ncbi:MAG: hypothetical protein IKP17_05970 [Oscillospiraceae bacterium]|jgi:uncharacterized membrane protein HdeD (DUF308 family)|nr:hypothetical protein [Oscillospiraceae bacterium]